MVPLIPEEILVLIFSYLHTGAHTTLSNLCLVSSAFKRAAQPVLYNKFQSRGKHRIKQVRLFLRTILEQPPLIAFVKHISLAKWDYDSVDGEQGYDGELVRLYRQNLLPPCGAKAGLESDFYCGSQDAQVAVLLALCSNVVSMEIVIGYGMNQESHVCTLLRQHWRPHSDAAEIPIEKRMLSKLESITARYWAIEMKHWPIEETQCLLLLPQLKRLRGSQCSMSYFIRTFEMSISNITHLRFDDSRWDVEGLTGILRACPKLTNLELRTGDGNDEVDPVASMAETWAALRCYATSLENLVIDPSGHLYFVLPGEPEDSPGSLKSLHRLRRLEVPLEYLINESNHEEGRSGVPRGGQIAGDPAAEVDRYSNEYLFDLYARLKEILPDSLTELKIPAYFTWHGRTKWRGKIRGPFDCFVWKGINNEEFLKMHLCRQSEWADCTAK